MKTHIDCDSKYGKLLWLTNGSIEVAAALDYGLRIMVLRCVEMENVLYHQSDDLSDGLSTEKGWRLYGGHRFWTSPESDESYYPDNDPVEYTIEEDSVLLTQKTDEWTGFKKQIRLSFCNNGNLKVEHVLTNCNSSPVKVAAWGITTLKGGGVAKIPFEGTVGGYVPNRVLSLWFDSSLNDSRLSFENNCIIGRHLPCVKKLKIGAYTPHGEISMKNLGQKLEIYFSPQPIQDCPENGCNVELFLNKHIMELETLGELKTIPSGATVKHVEYWHLVPEF